MEDRRASGNHAAGLVVLAALIAALLPWLYVEYAKAFNHDIYWLTVGAGRLLHGATMAGAVYDPNPPLSIVVYIPLYLLAKTVGVSFAAAAILTNGVYMALAAASVYALAKCITGSQHAAIIAIAFVLANTVLCTGEFGQRDQMVAITIMPLVLGQIILTRRIACSRLLLYAAFVAGAMLILLKPHFGIIPAAFLLHRSLMRRRLPVLDADFIILSAAAVCYLAIIWLCFRDYATEIFPDVVRLYLGFDTSPIVFVLAGGLAIFYITLWALYRCTVRAGEGDAAVVNIFFATALLALVPYVIEMKDYRYHLVPSLSFFWTGAGFVTYLVARRFVPPTFAAALMIAAMNAAGYAAEPPSVIRMAEDIKSLPLTRAVAGCGANCSYMVLSANLPAVMMTGYYSGRENASRFPSLWFLPQLLRMKQGAQSERLFQKYAGMLAEDIEKGKPGIVVACLDEFDYVEYFSKSPDFARAWTPYRADGWVPVNYGYYLPERAGGPSRTFSCTIFDRGMSAR